MKLRKRLAKLRLAVNAGLTVWKVSRMLNEKQLKLVNKCIDHIQGIAEAVADYTESEKDDQIVRQLNPMVDMLQRVLLEIKADK